jgi:hypothetical protein
MMAEDRVLPGEAAGPDSRTWLLGLTIAEQPRGQHEDGSQQCEYCIERDAHQPKRQ